MAIEIKPQPYLPALKKIEPEKEQRISPEQAKELAIATAASGAIGYGIYTGVGSTVDTVKDGAKYIKDQTMDTVNDIKNTDVYKNEVQPRIDQVEATIDPTDPRHDLAMKNWEDEKNLVTNYWGQKIDNTKQAIDQYGKYVHHEFVKNLEEPVQKTVTESTEKINFNIKKPSFLEEGIVDTIKSIPSKIANADFNKGRDYIKNNFGLLAGGALGATLGLGVYNEAIRHHFDNPISDGLISGTIGGMAGAFGGQKLHEYVKKNNEQSNNIDNFNYRY